MYNDSKTQPLCPGMENSSLIYGIELKVKNLKGGLKQHLQDQEKIQSMLQSRMGNLTNNSQTYYVKDLLQDQKQLFTQGMILGELMKREMLIINSRMLSIQVMVNGNIQNITITMNTSNPSQ